MRKIEAGVPAPLSTNNLANRISTRGLEAAKTPRYVEGQTRREISDIEIRQDGPLGLVTFNYDFVVNDKVTNSGIEHWQVCKIDRRWKILSITWTSYDRN